MRCSRTAYAFGGFRRLSQAAEKVLEKVPPVWREDTACSRLPTLLSGAKHASSTTSMSCVSYSTPLARPVVPASLGRQVVDNHGGRRRETFGPLTRQTSPSPAWLDSDRKAGFGRRWQPAIVSRRRMAEPAESFPPERSRRGPQLAASLLPLGRPRRKRDSLHRERGGLSATRHG